MDLLQNPFNILTASTRDNRQQIMELADERSLLLDSDECTEARSDLTNPRKRLSAEIAWLLGIRPKRVNELLLIIESLPTAILAVKNITPIARSNLLAAGLVRLSSNNPKEIAKWIIELSFAFEDIDLENLRTIINEERIVSGFPEVMDLAAVETALQERRIYYRTVIKTALDKVPSDILVETVTIAVETATNDGEKQGPILIDDIIDSYEVEAQVFLDKEEENIKKMIDQLWAEVDAEKPNSVIDPMVNQLIQIVKNWDAVAQPIQVSAKSRGHQHDASYRVANLVRSFTVNMFNKHGKLEFSQQLTNMLQEVFAEVGEVAERTAEDADTLCEIAERKVRYIEEEKNRSEEWKKEITYEVDVGTIFKNKLRITPEIIEWKGHIQKIESIKRIRWGAIRHYVNGVPTGTTYHVFYGDSSNIISLDLKKKEIYNNFIERLWKTVGVRLMIEYLNALRDGKTYRFGTTVITDNGVELERKKFFGKNERIFCPWNDLVIWNGGGYFCIGKKGDKKLAAEFSYLEEDNVHVLESFIRVFWKRGGTKLSSILEG